MQPVSEHLVSMCIYIHEYLRMMMIFAYVCFLVSSDGNLRRRETRVRERVRRGRCLASVLSFPRAVHCSVCITAVAAAAVSAKLTAPRARVPFLVQRGFLVRAKSMPRHAHTHTQTHTQTTVYLAARSTNRIIFFFGGVHMI